MTTVQTPDTDLATALRPSAHFTAERTWLNDPNGLLFHRGVYHLFFQNNPHGSTWGNISWGHATSTDLVTWTEQPVAIPFDGDEMVFSGSAVVDERNTAGFALPGQTALVAIYTSARATAAHGAGKQAQALAYSVDDGATWTKYAGNPVLDIGSDEFRDPKVFWYGGQDGHWVMVAVEAVARRVVVYTSPNLIDWTAASTFGPAHATGGVWECPDLFPLPIEGSADSRWVLVVSMNPGGIAGGSGTQYFVGDFDGTTFRPDRVTDSPDPTQYDWIDFGRDYYAAVSFSGVPDGRRLMVGWASNWDYANATPTEPWRSAMSLVREITLVDVDGRPKIRQRPVLPDRPGDVEVFHVTVPVRGDGGHLITIGTGAGEELAITVDGAARTLSSDRSRSGLVDFHPSFVSTDVAPFPDAAGDEIDLTIIVDGTIVEMFAFDGLVTLTQQVFPRQPYTEMRVTRHGF